MAITAGAIADNFFIIVYSVFRILSLIIDIICNWLIFDWARLWSFLIHEISPFLNPLRSDYVITKTAIEMLNNCFILSVAFVQI